MLGRGVRQGHPLSSYCLYKLSRLLKFDGNIKEIKIGDDETKVLAYADDMTARCPKFHLLRDY